MTLKKGNSECWSEKWKNFKKFHEIDFILIIIPYYSFKIHNFSKLRVYGQYGRGGQSHPWKSRHFGVTLSTKNDEFGPNIAPNIAIFGQKLSYVVKEVIITMHFSAIVGITGVRSRFFPNFYGLTTIPHAKNFSISSKKSGVKLSNFSKNGLKGFILLISKKVSGHMHFPTTMKGLIDVFRVAKVTPEIL